MIAGVAVLTTGAGTAVATSASASPAPAAPAVAPAGTASAAGAVRVVAPGERIAVAGDRLWLTTEGLHVASGTGTADVLRVADVFPGKVATIAHGDASGALFAGIYRGPVTATTEVTLTLGSRTLRARVVTLAGKPGWGAYYVFAPKVKASVKPSIAVRT
ncbi:hypothetical protein [Streptomyces vietnamensis]|uniref:Lipoprotein n=1 Tax=Streptomyces vietnamensis TaxID=362257 RepID=A0A0B5I5W9_9ACTN|nr:hypothetical protein [Streptomyces vietnamensis]AJF65058.1 hypothetical protein SVTN_12150 [Streptomyces vietnamensis]